jgi:hypothetical protein
MEPTFQKAIYQAAATLHATGSYTMDAATTAALELYDKVTEELCKRYEEEGR